MRRFIALLALGVFVASCSDGDPTGPDGPEALFSHGGPEVDLTSGGALEEVGGAVFQQTAFEGAPSGTGNLQSYVRLQGSPVVQGYNTSGRPLQFDENNSPQFTRNLQLNEVPNLFLGGVRSTQYREFRLDVNQPSDLSLDDIRIYLALEGGINDLLDSNAALSSDYVGDLPLVYELGSTWIRLDPTLSSGSGRGDMRALIPSEAFEAALEALGQDADACQYDPRPAGACGVFVYFYSRLGDHEPHAATFSEWAVQTRPAVVVSKTAVGSFDSSFDWDITKTAVVSSVDLFEGDLATIDYELKAEKGDPVNHNHRITGEVTVENVSSDAVTLSGIEDVFETGGESHEVELDCDGADFSEGHALPAGETLVCSYEITELDGEPIGEEIAGKNHVAVFLQDVFTDSPDELGFAASASVAWDDEPTNVVNDEVSVVDVLEGDDDTKIDLGTTSETHTFTVSRTFTCNDDEGDRTNVAFVIGDDDEVLDDDDAAVTIECHALAVSKTVETDFTRTFDWDIDKFAGPEADPVTELTIMPEQAYLLGYTVSVWVEDYADGDWRVSGVITIENDSPIDALLTGVTDVVSANIAATVTCGDAEFPGFPYTLEAGETLTCDYEAPLPDAETRTNTATATLWNQHFSWDEDADEGEGALVGELIEDEGEPVATDFTTVEDVVFGHPTTLLNQCVDVDDLFEDETVPGSLGTVCVSDDPTDEGAFEDASQTFTYTIQFGGSELDESADHWFDALECFANQFDNTATFRSQSLDDEDDPLLTGSASWGVEVYVECLIGCTLTQGYWKTHNQYFRDIRNGRGPPLDETWDLVGLGLDGGVSGDGVSHTFFLSEGSWGAAVWPEGSANSNIYYQAASQWIAAYLNIVAISQLDDDLDFEDVLAQYPEVEEAFAAGLVFFESTTPEDAAGLRGQDAREIREWRAVLAAFNEGEIGPGHCSEDGTSLP